MYGQMIIAEHASVHPDGTFSMLRAGIDRFRAPSRPVAFRGFLVVRIVADVGEEGEHQFDLRCLNMDGMQALPSVEGQFVTPPGGGSTNLILGLDVAFGEAGRFTWYLRVDRQVVTELPITVEVAPPPAGEVG
jgi:hypothetical protein